MYFAIMRDTNPPPPCLFVYTSPNSVKNLFSNFVYVTIYLIIINFFNVNIKYYFFERKLPPVSVFFLFFL